MKWRIFLLVFLLIPAVRAAGQPSLKVTADFPGGNVVVKSITNDTVRFEPDLAHTEGLWFYWYFKISGISGKTVTFVSGHNNVFTKFGPAYSINNDHTWKWYGENRVDRNSFTYTFTAKDTVAWFSMAFPYTDQDFIKFVSHVPNGCLLVMDTLGLSEEKRVIRKVMIPALSGEPMHRVLITARHHACEMMASYVLEGIIRAVLNDRNLQYMRDHTEFMIIPFVDTDGVENGDQGKNRIPRDHNRDYDGTSVHASTAAMRQTVPGWSAGILKVALDLHCPWIHGDYNECIYSVGNSDPEKQQRQVVFSKLLENNVRGELKYDHNDFLPFGKSWNTVNNYTKGIGFTRWAGSLDGIGVATTLEFPYANISGTMVSKDNSRVFGEAVAYTIQEYLLKGN